MTIRDFFNLLIKLFGLFALIGAVFSVLPTNISWALMDLDLIAILGITFVVLVLLGLFVILIYNSDKIVSLLHLHEGFDGDRIDFSDLKTSDIIKTVIFVLGISLLVQNIPDVIGHSFFWFRDFINKTDYSESSSFYWAVSAIKLFMGYLLVTNLDFFVKIFDRKNKINSDSPEA